MATFDIEKFLAQPKDYAKVCEANGSQVKWIKACIRKCKHGDKTVDKLCLVASCVESTGDIVTSNFFGKYRLSEEEMKSIISLEIVDFDYTFGVHKDTKEISRAKWTNIYFVDGTSLVLAYMPDSVIDWDEPEKGSAQ